MQLPRQRSIFLRTDEIGSADGFSVPLDSRLRGNDGEEAEMTERGEE